MITAAAIQLIIVLTLVLVGIVVPAWMPADLPFGVRVPPERRTAPIVLSWRRVYRISLLGFGVAAAVISAGAAALGLPVLATLSTIALVGSYLLLYYLAHRAIRAAKGEQDWYGGVPQAVATETSLRTVPEPYPWAWLLPSLVVIAVTAAYGLSRYGDLPDRLALHYGSSGRLDRSVDTTVLTAFAPLLAQVALTALIGLLAALPLRGPARLDPASPRSAAELHRSVGAALSRALLFLAVMVCLGLFFVAQQLWRSSGSPGTAALLAALATAVGVLAVVGTSAYVGGAARDRAPVDQARGARARDDDANWRGGLLYVNRDDPALLVPKRFGIGWTLNFGRPLAWVVLAVIVAVPVLTSVLAAFA